MSWVIMKFGGTSVGSPSGMENVAEIISSSLKNEYLPVAVLSACSSHKKSSGTTSKLLSAITNLTNGNPEWKSLVESVENQHIQIAQELLPPGKERESCINDLKFDIQRLINFMEATLVP